MLNVNNEQLRKIKRINWGMQGKAVRLLKREISWLTAVLWRPCRLLGSDCAPERYVTRSRRDLIASPDSPTRWSFFSRFHATSRFYWEQAGHRCPPEQTLTRDTATMSEINPAAVVQNFISSLRLFR